MKKTTVILVSLMLLSATVLAQPDRIGVGLTFAQKIRFNNGDTGNPGLNLKTWIQLDKRNTMHLVPSVSIYNPHVVKPNSSYYTTTYLFHGDLDYQFQIFHEKTLKVIGLAGVNYSHIISQVELLISFTDPPQNDAVFGFGPNIGGGLEMRMGSFWDFNVTGKYAFSGIVFNDPASVTLTDPPTEPRFISAPLTALIIQVQAVYYFKGRGKGYRR